MIRLRGHTLRIGALFIIALTVVPLALSGHQHTTTEASPCAACVATHHAPAANLAPLPRIAPTLYSFPLAATQVAAPVHVFRPFKTGRAPPVLLTARVA